MKSMIVGLFCFIVFINAAFAQQFEIEEVGFLPYWGSLDKIQVVDGIAYVTSYYGLMTFDVSDPAEPVLLDHQPNRESWDSSRISLSGGLVCMSANGYHRSRQPILFFDVTNPRQIEPVPTPHTESALRSGVVYGDYFYAKDSDDNIIVFDVSDINNPIVTHTIRDIRADNLIIYDRLLIAWTVYSDTRLEIFSLNNPTHPELLGSYHNDYGDIWYDWDVYICFLGSRFFGLCYNIDSGQYELECVDFSDPAEPFQRWVNEFNGSSSFIGEVNGLMAVVYYHDDIGRMVHLYSIEDPDTLIEVGRFQPIGFPHGIKNVDDVLYMSSDKGLHCFNIEDIENPELLGAFETISCNGRAVKIDDHLIVSTKDSTIRLVSVSDPENINEVDHLDFNHSVYMQTSWQSEEGQSFAIASDYDLKLLVMRIDNNELEPVGELEFDMEEFEGTVHGLSIEKWEMGVIVVSNEENRDINAVTGHFWVISLENPESPEVIGYLSEQVGNGWNPYLFSNDFALQDDYVYLPKYRYGERGSYIISIADPENPEIVTFERDEPFSHPVAIDGNLMFADRSVYQLDNPDRPEYLCRYLDQRETIYDIVVRDGMLALTCSGSPAFYLLDVHNPEESVITARASLNDWPCDFLMEDEMIYIIEPSGIQVLHYYDPAYIGDGLILTPDELVLDEPYPNPFNSSVAFNFELPVGQWIALRIYDLSGRIVDIPAQGDYSAGSHQIIYEANHLPSGIYIAKLEAQYCTRTVKLTLIR
ncbi:MAG: T9SS type A sorting domain-containing protein [Candidatus Hatepunaea meridiana]|nr:T9SS type A sorting domain-containing protein [Candidatus Hatepunaea meridiana]